MAALRVAVTDLQEGERVLEPRAARYVTRVRRVGVGESFIVFDGERGVEAEARLIEVRGRRAVCCIGPLRRATRSSFAITLIQALGKADKIDRVVRDATALGVQRIIVVDSDRSVPRLGERAAARRSRWTTIATEAAGQSGRGDLPDIEGPTRFAQALDSGPPGAQRIVLVPGAAPLVSVLDASPGAAIVLLIGPEGGFDPDELVQARGAGFVEAALGPFVLRTETAATAALGAVTALWSRRAR